MKVIEVTWLPLTADMSLRPVFIQSCMSSLSSDPTAAGRIFAYSVDYTVYAPTKDSRLRTPLTKLDSMYLLAQLSNTFKYLRLSFPY